MSVAIPVAVRRKKNLQKGERVRKHINKIKTFSVGKLAPNEGENRKGVQRNREQINAEPKFKHHYLHQVDVV